MRFKTYSLALMTATQLACSNTADIPLTSLMQTSHCPVGDAGLTLYRSPEALQQAVQAGGEAPRRTFNPAPTSAASALPPIAPNTWTLVLHVGQQPSAGYGVELASPAATVQDGALTIDVQLTRPEPGTMQATVVTTPCLLLGMAQDDMQNADVDRIVAEAGDKRWQLEL